MKTIKKLQINSDKLLNNEELVNLRGGYFACQDPELELYFCYCWDKPGAWYGCYRDQYAIDRDLQWYCNGFGACTYAWP